MRRALIAGCLAVLTIGIASAMPTAAVAAPVALPAGHPIQALSDAVGSSLAGMPRLYPHLASRPALMAEEGPSPWDTPSASYAATANHDGTITFYGTRASRESTATLSWLGRVVQGTRRVPRSQPMDRRGIIISASRSGPRLLSPNQTYDLQLMVHEHLHRRPALWAAWATMTEPQRHIEEGAVEALSSDLTPAVARRVLKAGAFSPSPVEGAYPDCHRLVRRASVASTARRVNSYAARVWRISFWAAGPAERERMLTAVSAPTDCPVVE